MHELNCTQEFEVKLLILIKPRNPTNRRPAQPEKIKMVFVESSAAYVQVLIDKKREYMPSPIMWMI